MAFVCYLTALMLIILPLEASEPPVNRPDELSDAKMTLKTHNDSIERITRLNTIRNVSLVYGWVGIFLYPYFVNTVGIDLLMPLTNAYTSFGINLLLARAAAYLTFYIPSALILSRTQFGDHELSLWSEIEKSVSNRFSLVDDPKDFIHVRTELFSSELAAKAYEGPLETPFQALVIVEHDRRARELNCSKTVNALAGFDS